MIPYRISGHGLWGTNFNGNVDLGPLPRPFWIHRLTVETQEVTTATSFGIFAEFYFQIGYPGWGVFAGALPGRPQRDQGPSYRTMWTRKINTGNQPQMIDEGNDPYHSGVVLPQTDHLYAGFMPFVAVNCINRFSVDVEGYLLTHSFMHNAGVFRHDPLYV
jgi:hypothetical protein